MPRGSKLDGPAKRCARELKALHRTEMSKSQFGKLAAPLIRTLASLEISIQTYRQAGELSEWGLRTIERARRHRVSLAA
jgi:hypothetical protein